MKTFHLTVLISANQVSEPETALTKVINLT